jgi:NlpC/P60 family putative phage cell wall peptidase
VGGGLTVDTVPHPENFSLRSSFPTSPQGGGEVIAIARAWIGTPYVHQASVKGAGCDCLGLLRGVWRELHGEEPESAPPYSPDWAEATGRETLYTAFKRHLTEISPCEAVGVPPKAARGALFKYLQPGDIARFRMVPRGPAKHCGVVAERNCVLTLIHARQNKRVSEEAFAPFWWRKLAFAFRLS